MKTLVTSVALILGLQAPMAVALGVQDQLRVFANCAGRLSAVMEYQWMVDGPQSEQTETQRDQMLDLVAAIMPVDQGRQVLSWRVTAKSAQWTLLSRATFNDDPGDAAWARRMADRYAGECTALLLNS
ncbi:hypothetical protein [Yoonia sp. 2307UL14-13]|uniref:hypothetical protein n=1 Tax=Yoonia sp. 2307UL14-13 TaxID=3126506 RepID=UPI0030A18809